ncbi:MAG TPA: hypothetical protein VME43_26590 [Bryobacteraceae bacterium]|nr:hypothetical protein [Bryobacteraceae bacterium]
MPPLEYIISATVLICEKILVEKDEVPSAIRLADTFCFRKNPERPEETPIVLVNGFFMIRFVPNAPIEHSLELRLVRPDGETQTIGGPNDARAEVRTPDTPIGFNAPFGFGLRAREPGIYYVTALLDGAEVAKAGFSLIEAPFEPAV